MRKRKKRVTLRVKVEAACLSVAVIAGFWVASSSRASRHPVTIVKAKTGSAGADLSAKAFVFQPRTIYRYSVIPGGAYSAKELAIARETDPLVAAHYADFGATARVRLLPAESYMYVSYRKNNHVYWTSKKLRIPKGELILEDGRCLARARCGNRLSNLPQQPTAPGTEPGEAAFNAPQPPEATAVLELPNFPLQVPVSDVLPQLGDTPLPTPFPPESTVAATPTSTSALPGFSSPTGLLTGIGGRPFPEPLIPTGSSNQSGGGGGGGLLSPPIVPFTGIGTPEPYSVFLAGLGFTALALPFYYRQRRRRGRA